MRLTELFPAAEAPDAEVLSLAYDNRRVDPGTLVFCVSGFTLTATISLPAP